MRAAAAGAGRPRAARERTLDLVGSLSAEDMARRHSPLRSPPAWDLGHVAADEELWLVTRLTGAPSLHPDLEDVYDAMETPRATRSEAPMRDAPEARPPPRRGARAREALAAADLSHDAASTC